MTEDYSDRENWPDAELIELFVRAEQESRSASQYWIELWRATHDEILRRMATDVPRETTGDEA